MADRRASCLCGCGSPTWGSYVRGHHPPGYFGVPRRSAARDGAVAEMVRSAGRIAPVARELGVSRQRVSEILGRYESREGTTVPRAGCGRPTGRAA